jgi:hypothetical protein
MQWFITIVLFVSATGYFLTNEKYRNVKQQWVEQQDVQIRFTEIKSTIISSLIDSVSGNKEEIKAIIEPKIESVISEYLNRLESRPIDISRPEDSLTNLLTLGIAKGLQVGNNQEYLSQLITDELLDSKELENSLNNLLQNSKIGFGPAKSEIEILSSDQVREIEQQMNRLSEWLTIWKILLISCGIFSFLLIWYTADESHIPIWITTIIFLILGVSTPFLSILVETGDIRFMFLGTHYSFDSGIFYYKAKSVIKITCSLISTNRVNEIILGVLVGLFSLFAPVVKLFVLPVLPKSKFKNEAQRFLWRFAWIDVIAVGIVVSFLATNQIINNESANSILLTGQSRLEDGMMFFLFFLGFSTIKKK